MIGRSYVLTDAAEADLRDVIHYTRRQWGVAQVRRYVAALERGMTRLANQQGVFVFDDPQDVIAFLTERIGQKQATIDLVNDD